MHNGLQNKTYRLCLSKMMHFMHYKKCVSNYVRIYSLLFTFFNEIFSHFNHFLLALRDLLYILYYKNLRRLEETACNQKIENILSKFKLAFHTSTAFFQWTSFKSFLPQEIWWPRDIQISRIIAHFLVSEFLFPSLFSFFVMIGTSFNYFSIGVEEFIGLHCSCKNQV